MHSSFVKVTSKSAEDKRFRENKIARLSLRKVNIQCQAKNIEVSDSSQLIIKEDETRIDNKVTEYPENSELNKDVICSSIKCETAAADSYPNQNLISEDPVKSDPSVEVDTNTINVKHSVLVEDYYWRDFLTVIDDIKNNDSLNDLFFPEDRIIIDTFTNISPDAQKLYVRLFNRKYVWHKVSSLHYTEINSDDLKPMINILLEKKFLSEDTSKEDTGSLIDLLPLPELKTLCKSFRLKCIGKKEVLAKSLIDFSLNQRNIFGLVKDIKTVLKEKVIAALGRMVKLSSEPRKLFRRILLLQSLPLARDIEADGKIPVLSTIPRVNSKEVVYPNYNFKLQNFFSSREALIRLHDAIELQVVIKGKIESRSLDEVEKLYDDSITDFKNILDSSEISQEDARLPLSLRSYTAGTVTARSVLYCLDSLRMKKLYTKIVDGYHVLLNQEIYLPNNRGKWYDQLALIYHHHMKETHLAVDILLKAMGNKTMHQTDHILLSSRASLIVNRNQKNRMSEENSILLTSLITSVNDPPELTIQSKCIQSKLGGGSKISYISENEGEMGQILSSVEETVILHHMSSGYEGIHAENAMSSTLFGLFFWDIMYNIDVPNAFICPYQTRPLDLKSGEFYENRKEAVDQRIREIEEMWSDEEMKTHIRSIWEKENGKESMIAWRFFEDLEKLEMLLECVGRRVISKICERMAKEYNSVRKGFPDIIIWNEQTRKCKFIEVKGPGDRLSPYQRSWLDFLIASGADAAVCHVRTVGAKLLKRKSDNEDPLNSINVGDPVFID